MSEKYINLNEAEQQFIELIVSKFPTLKNCSFGSTIHMFPQTWSSTAGGFEEPGMIAGCAMTTSQTTVICLSALVYIDNTFKNKDFYSVFFNKKLAYVILNPNKVFLEDLKNRNLKSVYDAKTAYLND